MTEPSTPATGATRAPDGPTGDQTDTETSGAPTVAQTDAQRRERYAAAMYECANPGFRWVDSLAAEVWDCGWRDQADAAMAVADEEQRELRAELEHWRPDGGDGYGTPVHWTVYNAMHQRALKAEDDRDFAHRRAEIARSAWSKTNTRLRDALGQMDRARDIAVALENQTAAVADLHRDAYTDATDGSPPSCTAGCGTWPCPTARALDSDGGPQ